MWQLYQFPLCPFSRKVRLMLTEKGIAHELKRVSPWAQDDEFSDLNPAGETPVLVENQKGTVLIDSGAICEYFEDRLRSSVYGAAAETGRMMGAFAAAAPALAQSLRQMEAALGAAIEDYHRRSGDRR